jgi:chemotaxis signal transduction protein
MRAPHGEVPMSPRAEPIDDFHVEPGEPAERTHCVLVVAEHNRERWAFIVDSVVGVVDVDERAMRAPPMTLSSARSGCARALATIDEGEAVVLDIHSLFSIFRGATA